MTKQYTPIFGDATVTDVTTDETGTKVTVKIKPLESVCYENDIVALMESYDPPDMSDEDLAILKSMTE